MAEDETVKHTDKGNGLANFRLKTSVKGKKDEEELRERMPRE